MSGHQGRYNFAILSTSKRQHFMRFKHFVTPLSRLFRSAPPLPARRARPGRDARFGLAGADHRDGIGRRGGNTARGGRTQAAGWGGIENPGRLAHHGVRRPSPRASDPASSLERTAQERVAQLIDAGTIDFGALCAAAGDSSALLAVAGLSGNPAHLPQALALIDDPHRVAALVIEGSSSRIRQSRGADH